MNVAFIFNHTESFLYDVNKPTYYTEKLSHQILLMLNNLTQAGAFIDVTPSSVLASNEAYLNTYRSELKTWLTDTFGKLSDYLLASSDSRGVLALASPPVLALTGTSLAVLPPAILAKTATSIFSDIVSSYTELTGSLRKERMTRLIDNALFEQSWFGDTFDKSFIEMIKDELVKLNAKLETENPETENPENLAKILFDAFSITDISIVDGQVVKTVKWLLSELKAGNSEKIIKILSKIFISNFGDLQTAEFDAVIPDTF